MKELSWKDLSQKITNKEGRMPKGFCMFSQQHETHDAIPPHEKTRFTFLLFKI